MTDLSGENERGERLMHGGTSQCIHCMVWEAINTYHEKAGLKDHTGLLIYDVRIILGNLGDVIAEILASLPDRNHRRMAKTMFDEHLRRKVAEYVESGNHPEAKVARMN